MLLSITGFEAVTRVTGDTGKSNNFSAPWEFH